MRKGFTLLVLVLLFSASTVFPQGYSKVQIEKVFRASSLSGVVRFAGDKIHGAPGALVEECTPKWVRPVASTRTDENGEFNLPNAKLGRTYYLRISLDGADPLLVRVKIVPKAGTLVLNLIVAA